MSLKPTSADLVVAFPAALLIFMGTALFSTLLGMLITYDISNSLAGMLILAFTSFITGLIIGLVRRERGPATALAAGEMTAVIFLILRLAARNGETYNTLIFGPLGMLAAIAACLPGGYVGARLREVK